MHYHDELFTFKKIAEATSPVVGKDFLKELVKTLADVLGVYGAWITELKDDKVNLRAIAMWLDGEFIENFEHVVKGTPCEKVLEGAYGIYHIPERIVQLFPDDPELRLFGAVSYMGIALKDSDGNTFGNLAVLDNKPMLKQPRIENIFKIFAARVTAELQRLHVQKIIEQSDQRLRRLVNGTHDAILELDERLQVTQMNESAKKMFVIHDHFSNLTLKSLVNLKGLQTVTSALLHLKDNETASPYHWFPEYIECQTSANDSFPAEATITRYIQQGKNHYILVLRNVLKKIQAEQIINRLNDETNFLREEIKSICGMNEICDKSAPVLKAMNEVQMVATTNATVLITGETGTGKELFANAIHHSSNRKDKPMIKVNCGALPANLIESELFGHEKGSFTGANSKREGRFAMANNGTIFLDEIGELPLELQPNLLRVLQEGEFEPVGSNTTVKVNVRVIAATNRNLLDEVRKGRFREDLYYRLNVFPIHISPLRERGDDVIYLAERFLHQFARTLRKSVPPLSERDKQKILSYPWPGNVRELRNVMERMVITSDGTRFNVNIDTVSPAKVGINISRSGKVYTSGQWREMEKENILTALKLSGGKISGPHGAAALLDLPASTLSSRMKALLIDKVYESSLTEFRELS